MKTEITLPDKPSDLLKVAIRDARELDRTTYFPKYSSWHMSKNLGAGGYGSEFYQCQICLAGAVIAGTLGTKPDERIDLYFGEDNDNDTIGKLHALEYFRSHRYGLAITLLGYNRKRADTVAKRLPSPKCEHFHGWEEFDIFLDSMKALAKSLKKAGM